MEIKEKIIIINRKFGGKLVREGSLDFACKMFENEKNIFKKNAYLIRGIIVDHPFNDFNKSTAQAIVLEEFHKAGCQCDEESFLNGIVHISRDSITDIDKLAMRLRKWCKCQKEN